MTKIPALYFNSEGCGPSHFELWIERHDPKRPDLGDSEFFGLRQAAIYFGESHDDGGFMLDRDEAEALYAELGKALGKGVQK
jgi:hypothetical protein